MDNSIRFFSEEFRPYSTNQFHSIKLKSMSQKLNWISQANGETKNQGPSLALNEGTIDAGDSFCRPLRWEGDFSAAAVT